MIQPYAMEILVGCLMGFLGGAINLKIQYLSELVVLAALLLRL